MAGGSSNVLERRKLDAVYGSGSPATIEIALFSAAPSDAGGGTELSGNGYARVSLTNNATNFPAASGGSPATKSNGTLITFPTATGNWNQATHWGTYDGDTGDLLDWAALDVAKTVLDGETFTFPIGNLDFTQD